jgi:hypothetical protein
MATGKPFSNTCRYRNTDTPSESARKIPSRAREKLSKVIFNL